MANNHATIFKHTCPIFSSADVVRDIQWYEERVGFTLIYSSADYQENQAMVDYAILERQGHFIHLQWHANNDEDPVYGSSVRIEVENIRPLFEEFVKRGTITKEKFRTNTPWGTNEFGFFDLNKNAIFFLEDVKK